MNEIIHLASMGTLTYNCFGYINFHPCLTIISLEFFSPIFIIFSKLLHWVHYNIWVEF